MGVIYKITNPKGKQYIGKTYCLKKRIACHKCASKKGTSIILHNSIKKYGWENHLLEIIETIEDKFLNERETFWIATLKTYSYENKMGMNMTLGGEGQRGSWMHDIERRKKMSENFKGEKNPWFGKHLSKETKKILSDKAKIRNEKDGRRVPQWGADKGAEITRKPIVAYNIHGAFISEFISLSEAAKYFNINRKAISSVLVGEQTQTGLLIFRYKTENYPLNIDVSEVKLNNDIRPVLLLNRNLGIIKEYPSCKEASKELELPRGSISRAAKNYNYRPIHSGHIFKYKDEYILEKEESILKKNWASYFKLNQNKN